VASDDVPLPLLERYAMGQCTPQELAELEVWVDGRPERRLFLERFQLLFAQPPESEAPLTFTEGEIEQAWGRLAERMSASATEDRARAVWRRRAAAVVACVVAAAVIWYVLAR